MVLCAPKNAANPPVAAHPVCASAKDRLNGVVTDASAKVGAGKQQKIAVVPTKSCI
jgi:hypothetical protein